LKLQLSLAEQGIFTRKGTDNLEAYDAYLRGLEHYLHRTQEANAQARQLGEKAVALDPQYAEAYTLLGRTYLREYFWGWNRTPPTLEQALVLAQKAIALDASLPMAHRLLAYVYLWQKQYDRAVTAAEQALALDPNDAEGYETLGEILSFAGRPQDASQLGHCCRWINGAVTEDIGGNRGIETGIGKWQRIDVAANDRGCGLCRGAN